MDELALIQKQETWNNIDTWHLVLPPSRPDLWQLQVIKQYIEKFGINANIAVLGATVEFRDLLSEMDIKNIYVFEKNIKYFYISNNSRAYNNEEITIWGNWLNTLDKFDGYFDVILSDLTSGNIDYTQRDLFYKNISFALKKDGIFIDRILTNPNGFIDIDYLISKYKKLYINLKTVNEFNCEILFCSSLLKETKTVDTNKIYQYLLNLNSSKITKFVENCYYISPKDCTWWYSKDWEEESKTYQRYLFIIDEYDEPLDSVYLKRCKLFISRRK